jgi:hypothetical protein
VFENLEQFLESGDPKWSSVSDPDSLIPEYPIRIQGFDDQKMKKKNTDKKKEINIFWIKNCNLLIPYLAQATGEAFSRQKRTPITSNMKFLNFFLFV